MPRKLPWNTEIKDSTAVASASTPTPTRQRSQTGHNDQDGTRPATDLQDIDRLRSRSTSPAEPPTEHFMTSADDKFRLVEDELLHTAGLFTAHLHRAEYSRLKRRAEAHHAAAIREIQRPVVPGPATTTARRRREAARRTERQRGFTGGGCVGTGLQGLMEMPGREAVSLAALPGVSGSGDDGEDDEDDPFGVHGRRVRRQKSRGGMGRTGARGTPRKLEPDTIPSFF
ncbi:hypothetical protein ED733_007885 [Metarhizium rileyi]|uniref:Uncharacterized protein n=1 Tax=Metarhizium rileyi (strain RCEF 4871) TaxID=1649241 RepID=A0A5C6GKK8_METRR|nr:hypothetical protein ED733_007885 [Metarhizium rileyi]